MYNNSLVRQMAERAIREMAEAMVDSYSDEDDRGDIPLGDHSDLIREMAADYAGDIIDDLRTEVIKMIETMKFSSQVEINVKFDG